MSSHTLSQIFIYPVKSLPGISMETSKVEERGLKYDRRWMLVNKENKFITQRFYPNMVFIDVKIDSENLSFAHKSKSIPKLKVSLNRPPQLTGNVQIWDDYCQAMIYSKEINDWFSEAIDAECKLVYMPEVTQRKTSTEYFKKSKDVSFADGYPYLIIGEKALEYLNSKLDKPVKMIQFRPNLVFSGGKEHEEDEWKEVKIGGINFAVVKPCARCVITTIDTEKGNKNKEPLSTLSRYRNYNNKILFGQNAIALSTGMLNLGDKISIVK
ncbi:MAG: MOSC domain-containing protein [Melioribacteraceae bacterium]|nr:MOSC domain-containing protein [Melioribacteraceae bacterium]